MKSLSKKILSLVLAFMMMFSVVSAPSAYAAIKYPVGDTADYEIHDSFELFLIKYKSRRIIAMEANDVSVAHHDFQYKEDDILIVGSEHDGFLPDDLKKCSAMVKIPMLPNKRSLNMAVSASIVLGEAMSQLKIFPKI